MKTFNPVHFLNLLINFILNLIEGLLMLRIILKLFGASTRAPFVTWVYETTQPLLGPFLGMFPSPLLTGGFIIEFSSLFALIVYAFVGYLAVELVNTLFKSDEVDFVEVTKTSKTKH
jgi:uncharacterized protein YggT (Ycf19 family)